MGISYDPPSKKWSIKYEKTDNPTNLKADYPVANTITFYAVPSYKTGQIMKGSYGDYPIWTYSTSKLPPVTPPVTRGRYGETRNLQDWEKRTTQEITLPITAGPSEINDVVRQKTGLPLGTFYYGSESPTNPISFAKDLIAETETNNKKASDDNKYNSELNAINLKTNTENQA